MVDQYVRIGKIGEGAYGSVYKARHKENSDRIVAIKKTFFEVGLASVLQDCVPRLSHGTVSGLQ